VPLRRIGLLLALALMAPGPVSSQDEESPDFSRKGADTCLSCHEADAVYAIFRTPHGRPGQNTGPFGQGQLQCEACHGPGDDHAGRVRRGQERPPVPHFASSGTGSAEAGNAQCLACHGSDVGFGWHDAAHNFEDLACVDCHRLHDPFDPVRQADSQADVCYECHQPTRTEMHKAFAHPVVEDKMACTSCHSPHGDVVGSELVRATVNETCDQCHAEKRGPYLWEHAPVAEDCTTCHSPHGSNQPAMLTQRAPVLCQSCHSQTGHPSVAMDTGGLASGTPSRFLLGESCLNCHSQVHGSNHPSGSKLMR